MSHQGAMWLERPEREDEEQPTKLLDALHLKPGDVIADIGAGSGFLSWRMAMRVGTNGLGMPMTSSPRCWRSSAPTSPPMARRMW